jgi:hypothetical protein
MVCVKNGNVLRQPWPIQIGSRAKIKNFFKNFVLQRRYFRDFPRAASESFKGRGLAMAVLKLFF